MAIAPFELLRHEEDFVAIDKPSGFHVHQPEFPRRRVADAIICLPNLRDQISSYLYPVHRLDVATEGVLLFALNKPSASKICQQFQNGGVKKTYFAVVRGWMEEEGVIDLPLELDSTGVAVESLTRFRTHAKVEFSVPVGKRYTSARYSFVEARPETGRFHQVRRHFARKSHPIVGDAIHGDSYHNRFFRTELELSGLWLKAKSIEFTHPRTDQPVQIESAWGPRWKRLFARLAISEPVE